MNQKLLLKVAFLGFCLAMVVATMKFSTSGNFKEGINQLFAVDSAQTLRWCPEHVVDFQWVGQFKPGSKGEKWSARKIADVKATFCSITMESAENLLGGQVQFKPLLLAQSAEGKTALLEWSPESNLFQVQGMPFKSTRLSRELLDEVK